MLNKAVLIGILVAGLLFTVDYSDIGVCDNCGDLARLEGFRLNLAEDGMNMYVELCPDCVQETLDSRQLRAKLNMHYCQYCGVDGAERVIDPITGEVLGYYCNDCFIERIMNRRQFMKTLLATIQRLEEDFSIPDSFEESCMLSKEEIVDEDTVTSEDLSKFSDDLLVCCSSFQHNGTDMLLSAIIDEDKHICMYLISEGESTIDSVITKRIIPVL